MIAQRWNPESVHDTHSVTDRTCAACAPQVSSRCQTRPKTCGETGDASACACSGCRGPKRMGGWLNLGTSTIG
jgi:hypothetical protein